MQIARTWEMPNSETFSINAIGALVKRYLRESSVSIDPFARNKRWATYTNDLNPDTDAEYHLEALEFLTLMQQKGVRPDLVIFDPPYSMRQCIEVYEHVGRTVTQQDTQTWGRWGEHKRVISEMLLPGGIAISCGWNSHGIGKQNGFEIVEILLVCHGGAHNDTIVTVEHKPERPQMMSMFAHE